MSEDVESKSHAGRWVITVVGALVLYVLSVGPVITLALKYDVSDAAQKSISIFYKPLSIGCERLGVNDLMTSYFVWWTHILHYNPALKY